jgi:hypothetical protein
MRRSRQQQRRRTRTRIPPAARVLRITNEEILGDLLYPASPSRIGAPAPPKAGR